MVFKSAIAFMYLLSIACPALSLTCPPPEEIIPCDCYNDGVDELRLVCYKVDISLADLKKLMNVFQKTGEKFDIELFWAKLGRIPSDFFRGFNIRLLEFSNCEMDLPIEGGERPFTGLEDVLEDILIISCFHGENLLTRIDWTHLRRLRHLDISHNAIYDIGDDWQTNLSPQLRSLFLWDNRLTSLGNRAFDSLPNLERFLLFSNRFGEVSRRLLANPLNHLYELGLNDNDLSSLPEDFFTGMPALRDLSLMNNRFTTIPERTFLPVWQQLEEFDISGNPLDCVDSNIDWMCRVPSRAEIDGTCQSPPERAGMELAVLIQSRRNELQGHENDGAIMNSPTNCSCTE